MKYGWFSQRMADKCGSVTFATSDGEVNITTITDTLGDPGSRWGDELPVFEVDPRNPDDICIYVSGQLKSWREDEQLDRNRQRRPRKRVKKDGSDRTNQ